MKKRNMTHQIMQFLHKAVIQQKIQKKSKIVKSGENPLCDALNFTLTGCLNTTIANTINPTKTKSVPRIIINFFVLFFIFLTSIHKH